MAQYIYTMIGVSKIVPPNRTIIRDISLSFFPGAKIGLLGLNGAGKSTLLRIMAGWDKDFSGEAWAAEGRASYETFIRTLLSVTDNIVDDQVVHPDDVVITEKGASAMRRSLHCDNRYVVPYGNDQDLGNFFRSLPTDHAAERKLALNEQKYPAERVRGSSKKYSEYR